MSIYDEILTELSVLYKTQMDLHDFCPLPDSLQKQKVRPCHRSVSDVLQKDTKLISASHYSLQNRLIAASPDMHWREVYRKDSHTPSGISFDFMERLGVYAIIGETGPFLSNDMSVYLVYMPAHLTYPWHYHLAEEQYFILSGEAVFRRHGHEDRLVRESDIIIHESNQPHEMQTYESPLLSLAIWRNHLDIAPTLMAQS